MSQSPRIELRVVSPHAGDVRNMFEQLDRHHLSLCPPEVCHLATPAELEREQCVMIGAFEEDLLRAIGGVKFCDGYGEITRMFVPPEHRGKGLSSLILADLLRRVRERGLLLARLETSDKFAAAMALYAKAGFEPCPPFGRYVDSPDNIYLEKRLE